MLKNFTETIYPNNRPIMREEDKDTIVRGGTCIHIFRLPFPCENYVQDLKVIYKQGLEVVLIKDFADCEVIEAEHKSIIRVNLSPADTLKFEQNLLDIYVQLKVVTIDNSTLYNTPIKLMLEQTLDN